MIIISPLHYYSTIFHVYFIKIEKNFHLLNYFSKLIEHILLHGMCGERLETSGDMFRYMDNY